MRRRWGFVFSLFIFMSMPCSTSCLFASLKEEHMIVIGSNFTLEEVKEHSLIPLKHSKDTGSMSYEGITTLKIMDIENFVIENVIRSHISFSHKEGVFSEYRGLIALPEAVSGWEATRNRLHDLVSRFNALESLKCRKGVICNRELHFFEPADKTPGAVKRMLIGAWESEKYLLSLRAVRIEFYSKSKASQEDEYNIRLVILKKPDYYEAGHGG